ncbi:multicopper oxidase family protein [Maritalea sp. S77]|jgi:FtsP/CotA-like multicopper oxidase with cupredoxin domain|uniref:multicopper oxidase family protein n=1 Tax=Maritalea sp. S77 TaxID=3415125 RepID=UPI003C7C6D83
MLQTSRRDALKLLGGGVAALVVVPSISLAEERDGTSFKLVAQPVQHKLHPAPDAQESTLWSYNGQVAAPTLRIKQGERVTIEFTNALPEPTSIHWHGLRIANEMDGVSGLTQDPVPPGESFTYEFVAPDAGTYWYHAHHKSWEQVARGLYGGLIVEPADGTVLPDAQDHLLIIDDWRLDGEGKFDAASLGAPMDWSHGGRLGNWLTVNGQSLPNISLPKNAPSRLRLINASNSRILDIDPGRFGGKILAFDGQALPDAPMELGYTPLLLGPAQRVDLLVEPEEDFVLEELSQEPFAFCSFEVETSEQKAAAFTVPTPNKLPMPAAEDRFKFDLRMTGGAMGRLDNIYYQGEKLDSGGFQRTKQFWAFNNVANLAEEPLFRVKKGQTVELNVSNITAFMHAMHVHGHHFLIEDRDGRGVEQSPLWRDTFLVGAEQSTRIAFVTDNAGKWLFHCHMLEHAASGMNAWFEVTV